MKLYKIIFLILSFLLPCQVIAGDILINDFSELINSAPIDGDVLTFTNNLNSDASIGTYFENLDITFEGNNHFLDGNNVFSGFTFNSNTTFNQVDVRHCKGQNYGAYTYAGAIYNDGGELDINQAAFNENFVDSSGLNLGSGGALYNIGDGNIEIESVIFANNYANGATAFGGAIANGAVQASSATKMSINNAVFRDNYAEGTVAPYGGAIYNSGTIDISNTSFENNKTLGEESLAAYAGALYNIGEMNVSNATITDNSTTGGLSSIVRGGAIYNNHELSLTNTKINGNYIDAQFYGDGGAIYNDSAGHAVIKDSQLENNYVNSSSNFSEGGAIANSGVLIIENTTLQNNYDKGELNDIHNYASGTVEFDGNGVNNVLSGISGEGVITKTGSGVLNLGGINNEYTGTFNLEQGTINLLKNSSYFNAQNTAFYNNTNFNMKNGEINNINFGNLTLNGSSNIFADINLNNNTMDRINADSVSGSGTLNLEPLDFIGTPTGNNISIPFANSVLKDYVSYTPQTIETPIYNYNSSYNSSNGNIDLARGGFNSSVFVPAVSAQLAGYLNQIDTYKRVFSNLDMVMITPPGVVAGFDTRNKSANSLGQFAFSPLTMPEEHRGIWFKPYSTFENVPLRGGPNVSNVSYGTILGGESELIKLRKGWYYLYGGYVSYNGSHQTFDGNGIYNNGGLAGIDAVFYKRGFFTAWTVNAGANSAEASTRFGNQDFVMFNTGIAEKTGYNFELLDRKLILQPSFLMSYSFINTFNYTTDYNVSINADPIHAIHIEPQIKIIGNFKNYLQPYISVSMVWNILDSSRFQANDVYIPSLSVKPFVEYGVGVQKRWGERLTGFVEGMIRNGGRNGIALQLGFRISI